MAFLVFMFSSFWTFIGCLMLIVVSFQVVFSFSMFFLLLFKRFDRQ